MPIASELGDAAYLWPKVEDPDEVEEATDETKTEPEQENRNMKPTTLDTYLSLLELFISAAHVLTGVDTETTKLEPAVFRRLQFALEDAIRCYLAAYLDDLRAQAKDATGARREEIEDAENRARFFGLDYRLDSLGFSFASIVRPRNVRTAMD